MAKFNCEKCPGYCCSYQIIPVKKRDLQRLADHFSISFEEAEKQFVDKGNKKDGGPYKIKRKKDFWFGKVCRFLDLETRACTIYDARMQICREYPSGKCGYYEFLKIERETQEDPDLIAITQND